MNKFKLLYGVVGVCIIATLGYVTFPKASSQPLVSPLPSTAVIVHCLSLNGLPDRRCTPGVVAESDSQVVCNRSTSTIRPPVSYTDQLKLKQIKEYGYTDTNPADYEEDHEIPLELGGSSIDPKNLWPQPRKQISNPGQSAEDKDQVENRLHQEVCSGQISLQQAQQEISTNWESAQ